MANSKQRYINTRLWNDSYVAELDPIEKLLFVYLLTNAHTNISGIYELPFKIMAVETGIDESMFKKIMPRIKDKIRYINGYVVIKNFIKHQETRSDLIVKGIDNCLKDLEPSFLIGLISKGYYVISDDMFQGAYKGLTRDLNYSNSNSNLDSNLDLDETKVSIIKKKAEQLPDWLDAKTWADWLAYRRQARKSTSEITIKSQIKFLSEHKEDHIKILEASITNGWTGLFPIQKRYDQRLEKSTTPEKGKYSNIKSITVD